MQRKSFIKKLGALSLAATTIVACKSPQGEQISPNSISSKKYNWKMVTTWPPNFPILGEGCTRLAKLINEMSAGQMTIKVYGGGELVPALETFEAVSIGGIEMGNSVPYYWAGKIPEAQFFASVPFGFNAQQMNTWLEAGGGNELWKKAYAPFNLIPFNAGNSGTQMGGWYNKEINSIADFKGLKMRIPGLGGNVLNAVGGSQVLVPGGEIYTNLERGVIDATEWLGPFHDYKMGFHQIAKYYYSPGWHELGTTIETIVNKKKFDALPPHLKSIITTAISSVKSWILEQFEFQNAKYLTLINKESEIEVRQFSTAILSELKAVSESVVESFVEKNPSAKEVYASFIKHKKQLKDWSNISERAFYCDI